MRQRQPEDIAVEGDRTVQVADRQVRFVQAPDGDDNGLDLLFYKNCLVK